MLDMTENLLGCVLSAFLLGLVNHGHLREPSCRRGKTTVGNHARGVLSLVPGAYLAQFYPREGHCAQDLTLGRVSLDLCGSILP